MNQREEQILKYIQSNLAQNGYLPTVRDICAARNIKSTSTVHVAMKTLEQEGYIEKVPYKKRAFKLTDKAWALEESQKNDEAPAEPTREDVVVIPVIGRVAAGTPILAEQNIEDSFPIPARFVSKGTNFMLTVHGESMIEAGINDGDYVLVRQQDTANNGDIVVAMVDGVDCEATVKGFYKENGHIRLQPYNSTMEPIIVDNVTIIGLVKGVFRYFN